MASLRLLPKLAAVTLTAAVALATGAQAQSDDNSPVIVPPSWATLAKNMFFDCIYMPGHQPSLTNYESCMNLARRTEKRCELENPRRPSPGCDQPPVLSGQEGR